MSADPTDHPSPVRPSDGDPVTDPDRPAGLAQDAPADFVAASGGWVGDGGTDCDPWQTGLDNGGGWHALTRTYPPSERVRWTRSAWGRTLCGSVAVWAQGAGVFDPAWRVGRTCAECLWVLAVRTDTVAAWKTRLGASSGVGELAVAVADAAIAAADVDGDELDDPDVVQLLAAVWRHAGEGLVDGKCAEGGCEHRGEHRGGAACPVVQVACRECSLLAGGWAGEREGTYRPEAIVDAPCAVLTALARYYDLDPRPEAVAVCGSMRFLDRMLQVAAEETAAGVNVLFPFAVVAPADQHGEGKQQLDQLHRHKIDQATRVVIVTDETGYVGDSTRGEIAYATARGLPIEYRALAEVAV